MTHREIQINDLFQVDKSTRRTVSLLFFLTRNHRHHPSLRNQQQRGSDSSEKNTYMKKPVGDVEFTEFASKCELVRRGSEG